MLEAVRRRSNEPEAENNNTLNFVNALDEACLSFRASFAKHNKLLDLHLVYLFPLLKGVNSFATSINISTTDINSCGCCLPNGEYDLSGSS